MVIRAIEELDNEVIDTDLMIENIAGTIWFTVLTAKFVAPMLMEKKLVYLYHEIMNDWEEIKDDEELNVLKKFANKGRFWTILYAVVMFSNIIPYMTIPAVMPMYLNYISYKNQTYKKELIHANAEFFIDQDKYFFPLYLHSIICGFGSVIVSTGVDTTYVVCVQHVNGLFNIVDHKLKKIAEFASSISENGWQNVKKMNALHQRVVDCVKVHQRAIEFADLFQETYDTVFFIVAVGLVAFFTFVTVDLQRNLDNPVRCHRLSTLWSGCILHLFYISWPAQQLIDSSENIYRSSFDSNWHEFPRKTKFLIQFMMMRSTKASALTAGPFLEMKFQGVSTILQAAYSYFSVLAMMSEQKTE